MCLEFCDRRGNQLCTIGQSVSLHNFNLNMTLGLGRARNTHFDLTPSFAAFSQSILLY